MSRVVVEEVTATSRGPDGKLYPAGGNGMFYIWADGETIEDVAFIDCTAEDAHTHGFNLNAVNLPQRDPEHPLRSTASRAAAATASRAARAPSGSPASTSRRTTTSTTSR